jgi:restriction system protein
MSECATKGIIVTTSTFGPDAYKFAKGKPLTLLDGNNLLFLLSKHGHEVTINLSEAKKLGMALQR